MTNEISIPVEGLIEGFDFPVDQLQLQKQLASKVMPS
jgi:hypothetical protein